MRRDRRGLVDEALLRPIVQDIHPELAVCPGDAGRVMLAGLLPFQLCAACALSVGSPRLLILPHTLDL